jgi:hypothetical protein
MNFIVILSSFFITYRLLRITNLIDSLICWFIIYLTQIILSELILGVLGTLYLGNVILFNLLLLLVIWLFTKNRRSSLGLSGVVVNKNEFLKNKVVLFTLSVIFCFSLVKISINLVNPPFGWDSLNYHFTFPVEWLKHGNFDIPITIFDDPSPSYYPINGSLFYLWLMLPLRNVFLADLGQLPFFVLSLLAVYGISRKIGLNKEKSFYAASLFLLIPNFFKQLQIAYVDVMVAGLFLACVNYLFLLYEKFSWKNLLIYSLSLGLLLGTKTIALPYSILLLLPFVYLYPKNIKKSYLFIILFFSVCALGGFSYVRNFLDTGNPFYPLDFKLFGRSIFKGVMDIGTFGAHFRIEDYSLNKILFHEGLGLQTLIIVLPSIFLALPITIIKKGKILNFNLIYFFILPFLIYFVYRYIIPLANVRYLYPLLGIGIILGFYVINILNIPKPTLKTLVTICLLTSMFNLAKRQELITSTALTFLIFLLFSFLIKPAQLIKVIKKPFFITLSFIFLISALILSEQWYLKNEFPRYTKMVKYSGFWPDATAAWDWLNRNTTGNNIAYAGRPVPFPLYGTNFKNNVYYVSVNKIEPAKLHYFANSHYEWGYDFLSLHKNLEAEGNYRSSVNCPIWLNNLLKRNSDYLFVYSLHQIEGVEFPIEDRWAKANSDRFALVFENETIHIYKILK